MRDPDEFDAFYKDARDRLLHQAYALTGDLKASRSAVRDAFVVAWHHWRKVSQGSPEDWARPYALQHAQRRHTARVWHREKGLDPEVKATFEALGRLSHTQRRVLLLTHLASVSLPDMAREVGLPVEETTRELQTATSQFAMHRDVATTSIAMLLRPLGEVTASARWPRASIIRRAGTTRRRTHTLAGAAVAVAAVAVTGVVVTDPGGARPTLAREMVSRPTPRPTDPPGTSPEALPASALLDASALGAAFGGTWTEAGTHDNTEGDGLVLPCQGSRYADPRASDALVRKLTKGKAGSTRPASSAFTQTELSRTDKAADAAYDTVAGWFSGCTEGRTQLMSTWSVDGVGDRAVQMVLHDWQSPESSLLAGVVQTGRYVSSTVVRLRGDAAADPDAGAALLAASVPGVCDLEAGGSCADSPKLSRADALAVAEVPTMVVEADLPPVGDIDQPWVGTRTTKAKKVNAAATRCDNTSFQDTVGGTSFQRSATRTFLLPEADLPPEFGLTETVGELPEDAARSFVAGVRKKMGSCEDRDLGSEVYAAVDRTGKHEELAVWHVTTEVSDNRTVRYFMAVARSGGAVLQIGFVPAPKVEMRRGAFVALAERGLERLRSGVAAED